MSLSRQDAIRAIIENENAYCELIKLRELKLESCDSEKNVYFDRTWEIYDATLRAALIINKKGGSIQNNLFSKIYSFLHYGITADADSGSELHYPQALEILLSKIKAALASERCSKVLSYFIKFSEIWYNIYNEKYLDIYPLSADQRFNEFLSFWSEVQTLILCSKKWTTCIRDKFSNPTLKFDNLYVKIFQEVFFHPTAAEDFYNTFIMIYRDLREGNPRSLTEIRDFIAIVNQMENKNIYLNFEKKFLTTTNEYYTLKVSEIQLTDIYTITQCNQEIFTKEKEFSQYFNTTTQNALVEVLKNVLIVDNLENFSGICFLIKEYLQTGDVQVLSQILEIITMYNFVTNHLLCTYITEIMNAEILAFNSADKISHILNWSQLYDNYINLSTKINDVNFSETIFKEMKRNFNLKYQDSSMPEVLSFFCDVLMKPNFERVISLSQEQAYQKISNLLTLIIDKDLFINYCRQDLCLRLLENQNINMDEKEFTSFLKLHHGYNLIMRLETMITDRVMSKQFFDLFREYCDRNKVKVDKSFSALILSSGVWPKMQVEKVEYPSVINNSIFNFESFYKGQNNGNKIIQWVPEKSSCTLTATFDSGKYELSMSCFQGVISMLFNEHNSLSLADIIDKTSISGTECKRALVGLVCGKYKILQGSVKVELTDSYTFNSAFAEKKKKLSIPLPKLVAVKKQIVDETNKNRSYMIDAAIVRIMKARRKLSHMELFTEVMSQIKLFRVEPKILKTAIEELITREYISRDPENIALYNYVA